VVNNADPLTFLAIRMALVVLLMAVIVAIARPRSSSGGAVRVQCGALDHGVRAGATWFIVVLSIGSVCTG
jgi:hypothetical protein